MSKKATSENHRKTMKNYLQFECERVTPPFVKVQKIIVCNAIQTEKSVR